MTSRIGRPDTDADRQLREFVDRQPPSSFVMVAGAGSGKTTSLVKALDHLARTRGATLRRRGQQIACITYTQVAVGEIWGDVGNAPLFLVSTIHSFLWTIVRQFQNDIRDWVCGRIDEKIAEAEEKIAKPRTQARTRDRLTRDIERYRAQRADVVAVDRFTYGTGSDYPKGVLGHDDILRIGPKLIAEQPLLRKLVASRFPFIFVDESQDTNPAFVAALRQIAETAGEEFCLGFFGDPMQKIYGTGAGPIELGDGWNEITKPENFRCPTSVLRVINSIRVEDDGLEQIRGRMIERDGALENVVGTARLFILPADDRRTERLAEVRRWLAIANADPFWESDDHEANVRVLVLVHEMAARRLGFPNLYTALNNNNAPALKDGLRDGTAWVLRPFLAYILPLVLAARAGADFEVVTALRANCPLLSKERLVRQDVAALLERLTADVHHLIEMLSIGSVSTVREVLTFVRGRELASLDERFIHHLDERADAEDEEDDGVEDAAVGAFLECPVNEIWGYHSYIEEQSPFTTHHGVKGAEFERVLVILDDEEAAYTQYSYNKYFGIAELSNADREHIARGEDSVLGRTRRLFYVCCSRAVRDLAVVLFVPDVPAAARAAAEKAYFPPEHVHQL